jgi:hypothetical protein
MRAVGVSPKQAERESSPVYQTASRFHQDFGYERVDIHAAGLQVIERMLPGDKVRLRAQLLKLMTGYPGKDQRGLRNAWKRLGAQWCGPTLDLRGHIERWLQTAYADSGVKHDV